MANHISHAGIPFPVKGCKYTLIIPYLDADGDPIDPTTPDSEVSTDAATFVDCTNEVTVIGGGNGVGYLTLTAAEMTGNIIAVAAKSANAKTTILTLTPYEFIEVSSVQPVVVSATSNTVTFDPAEIAGVFGTADMHIQGIWVRFFSTSEVRVVRDYVPATGQIVVIPPFETIPSAGHMVIFGFPVGLGTILEQFIRSGGSAR
jgi:hypothetical protein